MPLSSLARVATDERKGNTLLLFFRKSPSWLMGEAPEKGPFATFNLKKNFVLGMVSLPLARPCPTLLLGAIVRRKHPLERGGKGGKTSWKEAFRGWKWSGSSKESAEKITPKWGRKWKWGFPWPVWILSLSLRPVKDWLRGIIYIG